MKSENIVLVVDDNEMNRDLLARRLLRQGHQVDTAVNGVLALEKMRAHSFDLVLLDIMMPEMNGYQVLEHMKADENLRHIPVIVISAADNLESIVTCIQLGAEDYLPKPYNAPLLKARIGASLEKKNLRDKEQARMEELSTLQQIDQELNATLDTDRAMEVTLKWALAHTGDEAGFIGEFVENRIRVATAEGYTYELTPGSDDLLPDELPAVQYALESKKAAFIANTGGIGVLGRAQSQLAMPIRRQDEVIAILVMENTEIKEWSEASVSFLNRLSDHAAMAIANGQMYAAVQAADLAKTEFVSFVSHELKIPMTSIKGYSDLLLTGNFGEMNEMQMKFLETIRNNVERMARLVSDLADISRIESGHLFLETRPTSLVDVVNEVVQSTNTQILDKQQQLTVEIEDDLPMVWGDRNRLVQIMINLVSNANKYTPEKGHIEVRAEVINESEGDGGKRQPMVQVAVTDTGLGIKEEDQETIFQKFFRAADDEAQKSPGTGLGLSITKSLVELHNGRIWFESKYRKGTTFYFVLPVASE